jgi:hypothetical protein
MEVASRSLAAVAAKAGGFEERPNVLFKCNVFRVGGGRKLRLVCGRNLGGPIDSLTTRAWTTPVRPTKTAWAAGATARTAGSIRAAAWCSAGNSLAGVRRLILGGVVVAAENCDRNHENRSPKPSETFCHHHFLSVDRGEFPMRQAIVSIDRETTQSAYS